MTDKLKVVPVASVPVEIHKLTPAQVKALPLFLAAREEFNVASKAKDQASEALGLPKFEGQKVNVHLTNPHGKVLAVVEVRYRDGYPVAPGWINKLVALGIPL